eukprot:Gb_28213 [translate_table: standard]
MNQGLKIIYIYIYIYIFSCRSLVYAAVQPATVNTECFLCYNATTTAIVGLQWGRGARPRWVEVEEGPGRSKGDSEGESRTSREEDCLHAVHPEGVDPLHAVGQRWCASPMVSVVSMSSPTMISPLHASVQVNHSLSSSVHASGCEGVWGLPLGGQLSQAIPKPNMHVSEVTPHPLVTSLESICTQSPLENHHPGVIQATLFNTQEVVNLVDSCKNVTSIESTLPMVGGGEEPQRSDHILTVEDLIK